MQFTTIIHADQLVEQLRHPGAVVFDTRFSLSDTEYGTRAYAAGHIPGAYYLHLDRDLSSPVTPSTGRHPLPRIEDFAEVMRSHGVSNDTQVFVYDDAAGMFAVRCWWLLRWLGHEKVAVLDGGLQAWFRAGGAEDVAAPATPERGDFQPRPQPDMLVTAEQLERGLAEHSIRLCDARAAERFRGDVEPIDKVAGHVPGARNVPFAQNLDANGCFRPVEELARLHQPASGQGERIAHMCGSGVTACHNVLATALTGQPLPALYAGSWSEWITDARRPVEQGASQSSSSEAG